MGRAVLGRAAAGRFGFEGIAAVAANHASSTPEDAEDSFPEERVEASGADIIDEPGVAKAGDETHIGLKDSDAGAKKEVVLEPGALARGKQGPKCLPGGGEMLGGMGELVQVDDLHRVHGDAWTAQWVVVGGPQRAVLFDEREEQRMEWEDFLAANQSHGPGKLTVATPESDVGIEDAVELVEVCQHIRFTRGGHSGAWRVFERSLVQNP